MLCGYQGISYEKWIAPINDKFYCSSAIPYENEMSVTQLTARLIGLCCKFRHTAVPDYLKRGMQPRHLSFLFPLSYQGFEASVWREEQPGKWVEHNELINRRESLCMTWGEVTTPSGSPYALKFWAGAFQKNDCLRIYRWSNDGMYWNGRLISKEERKYEPTCCTRYLPGQTIRVNLLTRYNPGRTKVCLVAYSSMKKDTDRKSAYVYLKANCWETLTWTLPSIDGYAPDCISIEVVPELDSGCEGYCGLDLYMDDFCIEGTPQYDVARFATNTSLHLEEYYPILRNFNVCYGDVYYDQSNQSFRFYPGFPVASTMLLHYQTLAAKNGLSMAFTSALTEDCTIDCMMRIAPPDVMNALFEMDYKPDAENGASLLAVAVRGITRHYAVGFYKGSAGIFIASDLPGMYEAVNTRIYDWNQYSRYQFHVTIVGNQLTFTLSEDGSHIGKFVHQAKKMLSGCIGFVGIKNGFSLLECSISPFSAQDKE